MTDMEKINIGIYCYILFTGEPWDSAEYFYISFSEWEDEASHDVYGVPDNDIFYYFSDDEANDLIRAIDENHRTFSVDPDWEILLSLGYDLAYNDYSEIF